MDTITAILTVWKRNHLEEQILALINQTLKPNTIWVQQTQHHVNVDDILEKYQMYIKYTYWKENPGVFGRFEAVRQVTTNYVYIIDDDMIPGKGYLKNALRCSKHMNAIISSNGRLLNSKNYFAKHYIGDGDEFQHCYCSNDTIVDFGNNSWFFKTDWINYFFQVPILYRNNGEDIHLSATCLLFGNIPTYVPKQIIPFEAGNTKREYSSDEFALHKKIGFTNERIEIIKRFLRIGWVLQLNDDIACMQSYKYDISVVMPISRKTDEVIYSINSILSQTFKNFEFIIIFIGDWDISEEIENSKIRWINTKQNESLYTMINIACATATGKYISFMCQDYISDPKRLEIQYNYMELHNETVATGTVTNNGELSPPSLCILKSALKQVKYYNDQAPLCEKDLIHRLSQKGQITVLNKSIISKIKQITHTSICKVFLMVL